MRQQAFLGLVLGLLLSFVLGVVWNTTWESRPAGTELASDLDLFIQEFKDEVANRTQVESIFGIGTDDNGLARLGSARAFIQDTAPTSISGLGQYDSTAGAFAGTALATEEIGASTVDLGTGRLWVDGNGATGIASDDRQLHVWVDTVGFQPVRSEAVAGVEGNLIYHGSFELTDGTGSLASTTVPVGWTVLGGPPTFTYQDPPGVSEGEGLAVNITGAVGPDSGIQQTLAGLKASTTYIIRARVNPVGGTCDLSVTGGTVSPVTSTSATGSGVYETLEVTPTTTGVPGSLVVRLESNAVGNVCRWDHVVAFERNPVVPQPGTQVCFDTDASTTNDVYTTAGTWVDALVSCAVTPPGPGYIVQVKGQVVAENDAALFDPALLVRLRENGTTTRAMGSAVAHQHVDAANDFRDIVVVPVFFTSVNPTPGTTLTYTLEASPSSSGGDPSFDRNLGDDGADDVPDGANLLTTLEVTLIPTR